MREQEARSGGAATGKQRMCDVYQLLAWGLLGWLLGSITAGAFLMFFFGAGRDRQR